MALVHVLLFLWLPVESNIKNEEEDTFLEICVTWAFKQKMYRPIHSV